MFLGIYVAVTLALAFLTLILFKSGQKETVDTRKDFKRFLFLVSFVSLIGWALFGSSGVLIMKLAADSEVEITSNIERCKNVLKESTTKGITDFSFCDDADFRKLFLKDSETRNKLFDLLKTENK